MKSLFSLLLFIVLTHQSVLGLEIKSSTPTLPDELQLKSGRVIRNFKVIRWEKDKVVVKHAGGAEPIPFSLITNVPAKQLAAISKDQLARYDEAKKSADGYRKAIEADAAANQEAVLKKWRDAGALKGNLAFEASWSSTLVTMKVKNLSSSGSETFEWRQIEATLESGAKIAPTDIQIGTGDRLNYSIPPGETRTFMLAFGKYNYQDAITAVRWK